MKRLLPLLLLLVLVAGIGLFFVNSKPRLQWYRGNTHTHTLWSDGNDFPEMVAAWYRDQGYDFLCLSDHNILSVGEKWMNIEVAEKRRKTVGSTAMEKYRTRFGDEWVRTRSGKKGEEVLLRSLPDVRSKVGKPGEFLMIQAEEITDSYESAQIHINAINLQEVIPPTRGTSVEDTIRKNIRAVRAQAEATGQTIVAHVNHPNFLWSLKADQIASVEEVRFMEIYNGHPGVNQQGDATRPGDEAIWDLVNTSRLRDLNLPPVLGVATDDSHHYHGGDVSPGRGWIMVLAEKLETKNIVGAIDHGDFYCSTGVKLRRWTVGEDRRSLRIAVEPQVDASYTFELIGALNTPGSLAGTRLDQKTGTEAVFRLGPDVIYARVRVTSSLSHPNPSFKGQLQQAWSQPVVPGKIRHYANGGSKSKSKRG